MLGGLGRQVAAPLTRRVSTIHTSFVRQNTSILRQPPPAAAAAQLLQPSILMSLVQRRLFHATAASNMPLDEFRDPVPRAQRMQEPVGRKWSVRELRRKSYDDLHKLWYVLYKERNMLLTEQQLSRRRGLIFPQPERMRKVKKSMGAIKHVLGERKRAHLARIAYAKAHGGSTEPRDDEAMIMDMDSAELLPAEDVDSPTEPKQTS